MSKPLLAAIPIKPFGVAKRRLAGRLDGPHRSRVGRAIAARTAAAAEEAGAHVAIVTGDSGVAAWAEDLGYETIDENHGTAGGLNGAAQAVVREAARRQCPWAVLHADLPLVTAAALHLVFDLARTHTVLAPSYNGGTNAVGSYAPDFDFSYGTASFQRHLARNTRAVVHTDVRVALDLDTEHDLAHALSLPGGSWLRPLVV